MSATVISVSLAVGLNQAVVRAKVGPTLKKVLQKVRGGGELPPFAAAMGRARCIWCRAQR